MLNPDEIKRKLTDMNLKKVSESSGLPYQTVYRFATSEETKRPSFDVVKKLSEYFEARGCHGDR